MVMDSLRYWALDMHVDGFRFDLARHWRARTAASTRARVLRHDPAGPGAMTEVKLIAEPWDVGPYGYQLGNFPPGWAEWNAQYRDAVRRFWKGDHGMVAEMASRIAGSSDIFGYRGRRPWASINFITAHDGFTLHDLVSYEPQAQRGQREENRDGHDANFSWNCGVEGPTDDPEILVLRDRQKRNLMATLLLSLGVPMLLAGDEFGNSQQGNNNAYCQDNEISWLDWHNIRPEDEALRGFVRHLIRLRRRHRVFSRPRFFRGEVVSEAGLKDITWVTPAGIEATAEDWGNASALSLGYVLCGAAGEFYTPGGQRDIDESFLVMMNAYHGDLDFHVPHLPVPLLWEALIDTIEPTGRAMPGRLWNPGEAYRLSGNSFALFINRAPASVPPPAETVVQVAEPAGECHGTTDPWEGAWDGDAPV
jgi:isoamylase